MAPNLWSHHLYSWVVVSINGMVLYTGFISYLCYGVKVVWKHWCRSTIAKGFPLMKQALSIGSSCLEHPIKRSSGTKATVSVGSAVLNYWYLLCVWVRTYSKLKNTGPIKYSLTENGYGYVCFQFHVGNCSLGLLSWPKVFRPFCFTLVL